MNNPSRGILLGVGLIAGAALLFEVAITRVFAVTLWYYFGFGAVSLALMGTAAAAGCCFLAPKRFLGEDYRRYLSMFALLFAAAAPISILVHLHLPLGFQTGSALWLTLSLAAQLLPLFAAFFTAGMCISIALCRYSREVNRLYFVDLVGAALGSVFVVPLLYVVSAPAVMFAVSMVASAAGFAFSEGEAPRKYRGAAVVVFAVSFVLLLINDHLGPLTITHVKSYTSGAFQGREGNKVFEKWSPVSRVVVMAPEASTRGEFMTVTNDAGAPTRLNKFDGDFAAAAYVKDDSREIVHQLKQNADVLVLGSGGGMDVLTALVFNQKSVTAVEINPVIAELVTRYFSDYIGKIFNDPRVRLFVQEGRNYAAGAKELFDIVQITMIDSWAGAAAGAYLFNENSLYTKEAVRDYLNHLRPDGMLSITRYAQFHEAIRLTNLILEEQSERGVNNAADRLIVVVEPRRTKYRRVTVLLKAGVVTEQETALVLAKARETGFTVVYAPNAPEAELEAAGFARGIRALITVSKSGDESRKHFVQRYPKNIAAPSDNWPFFFFNSYLSDVFHADPREHPARRMAMPFLYGTFIVFAVISLLTILLPLWLLKREELRQIPMRVPVLLYFACLGCGFMLIEISLIQRLTVFLGHPTYSFVVVLSTLLFSSGLGSLLSAKINPQGEARRLCWVLAAVILVNIAHVLFLYDAFISLMAIEKSLRIALAVAALFPTGFVMGMCFPMGVQIARRLNQDLVAWGWGINGACSVFASVLSLVIALNAGLKAALACGVVCYLAALLLVLMLESRLLKLN